MPDFQQIMSSLPRLSHDELVALRDAVDIAIGSEAAAASNGCAPTSELIGLFADAPDVMDRVMEAVYENRARPWRVE